MKNNFYIVAIVLFSLTSQYSFALINEAKFSTVANCYEKFADYSAYREFIMNKNPGTKAEYIDQILPKQDIESAFANTKCDAIQYVSDGYLVPGVIITPLNTNGQPLPILIFNRGGNSSFGALTYYDYLTTLAPLAEAGFIVLASQYRGISPKHSDVFGNDEFGGEDVKDVHVLIEYAKTLPNADPSNLFIYGISRGGLMTYKLAKERSDITAIAVKSAPTDLREEIAHFPDMERVFEARIPGYPANKEQALSERSVVDWYEEIPKSLPILILQGLQDKRVDAKSVDRFAKQLKQDNRPVKYLFYPDGDHFLKPYELDNRNEIINWFKLHTHQ